MEGASDWWRNEEVQVEAGAETTEEGRTEEVTAAEAEVMKEEAMTKPANTNQEHQTVQAEVSL